jgi:hypothetical protein
LAERWRQWQSPLAIEPADQGILLPDGRLLAHPQIAWPEETIERFRAGYKCVNCLEPQEHAWPERCSLCGYPMRTEQTRFFAHEFGGEIEVGSTRDWEEELDGLEERRRKEEE